MFLPFLAVYGHYNISILATAATPFVVIEDMVIICLSFFQGWVTQASMSLPP